MRSVRVALALGATLAALALAATLTRSPPSVARTNGIPDEGEVASTQERARACQPEELLPAGTSAIRLTLGAEIGPQVGVTVRSGTRIVTRGVRRAGWTGGSVTVPVHRVSHATSHVNVCFALGRPLEAVKILGNQTAAADALVSSGGERLSGRMGVEYLRPGQASWLSLLPSIARHMGRGHAWSGTWIVFALLTAMASVACLIAWLTLRELR